MEHITPCNIHNISLLVNVFMNKYSNQIQLQKSPLKLVVRDNLLAYFS